MTAPQTFALAFSDDHIVRARDEHVCLTDMWKADGADSSKAPAQWLRSAQAVEFQQHLVDMGISHVEEVVVVEKGGTNAGVKGGGGTWAHWHLAMAYAKYLSPAFHVKCNEIVRDHMQALRATPTAPAIDDAAIARIAVHAVRAMLPDLLESMRLADPDRTVIAGSTGAFEVATEAGFGEKRRNAVAGAISRALVAWCVSRNVAYARRASEYPGRLGRFVFPRSEIAQWRVKDGTALFANWRARLAPTAQLDLPLATVISIKRPRKAAQTVVSS